MVDPASLHENLKRLIVESLRLDGLTTDRIGDETPLFGGELGLDSVDALELVMALEKEYGIKIRSEEVDRNAFATVAALGNFVARNLNGSGSSRLDGA